MCDNTPQTTDSTIIFRYQNSTKSFDTRSYSPLLTNGRMSTDEVQRTLQEIQNVQQPFTKRIIKAVCIYILFALVSVSIYVGVILSYDDPDTVIIAAIIYSVVACFFAGIYIFKVIRIRQETKKAVQATLDHYNQSAASRGLRWNMPKQYPRWLELQKEYYTAGDNVPLVSNMYLNYGMPVNSGMMGQGQNQQFAQNYYGVYPGNNAYNMVNIPQQAYNGFTGGYNPQQTYIPPQQTYH